MFNNIGEKIKFLAKFLFWLTAIMGIVLGLVFAIVGGLRAVLTAEKLLCIFVGIAIIIGGFLLAWIQNFVLYGYGELIDSNQKILKILEEQKNEKHTSKK